VSELEGERIEDERPVVGEEDERLAVSAFLQSGFLGVLAAVGCLHVELVDALQLDDQVLFLSEAHFLEHQLAVEAALLSLRFNHSNGQVRAVPLAVQGAQSAHKHH